MSCTGSIPNVSRQQAVPVDPVSPSPLYTPTTRRAAADARLDVTPPTTKIPPHPPRFSLCMTRMPPRRRGERGNDAKLVW